MAERIRSVRRIILISFLLSFSGSCEYSERREFVSRAEFEVDGRIWPLLPDSGWISCGGGQYWFETGGRKYRLGGRRAAQDRKELAGIIMYRSGIPTKRQNSDGPNSVPGTPVYVGDLVFEARRFCRPLFIAR